MTVRSTPVRRGWSALAAVALGGGGLIVAAPPALAAACESTASGVTVVVTFPNGSTSVRCSPGDPGSGAAALSGAGFSVTQVQTQPGFVCRIDGAPASDPCVRTPPTSAYWSYWYAQPGGSWTYSSAGGFGRNPAPGTVEGWSFGAGSPPAVPPPAVSAPAPPPAPAPAPAPKPAPKPAPAPAPSTTSPKPATSSSAPRPSTSSSASSGTSSSSGSAPAPAGSAATGTPSQSPTSASPTGTPAPSAGETAEPTTETTTETESELAAGTLPGTGDGGESSAGARPQSMLPTLAGLGVVGALLGTAGWMGWRRRTAA